MTLSDRPNQPSDSSCLTNPNQATQTPEKDAYALWCCFFVVQRGFATDSLRKPREGLPLAPESESEEMLIKDHAKFLGAWIEAVSQFREIPERSIIYAREMAATMTPAEREAEAKESKFYPGMVMMSWHFLCSQMYPSIRPMPIEVKIP